MLQYDESCLREKLDRLPQKHRAAFAAACAERLFPAYARFAKETACDALDCFLMSKEEGFIVAAGAEQRVLEHPLVQAELLRQRRDLGELVAVRDRDIRDVAARFQKRAEEEGAILFG